MELTVNRLANSIPPQHFDIKCTLVDPMYLSRESGVLVYKLFHQYDTTIYCNQLMC